MKDRPRSGPTRSAGSKAPAKRQRASRPASRAVKAPKVQPAKIQQAPRLIVDVTIAEPAWLEALSVDAAAVDAAVVTRRLRAAARRAMAIALADRWRGSAVGHDCSIVLSSDRQVRRLNRDYRGQDKPTNVLSFAALDGGMPPRREIWPLGDVILALGVCRKEARAQGKELDHHLVHLVIHGVLHLLGYDHDLDDEADRMEGLEIAALKRLGIGNPYVTA